jgi:hypothetical protein
MNYELAKELKDAGWPQDKLPVGGYSREPCYIPTLEELIEACGGKFHSLARADKEWWASELLEPFADKFPLRVGGSTPTEAVARLWLALNEKK